jgi:hypothetical protein
LLVVARCFWVLRSEWCQRWCQMASAAHPIPMGLIAPSTSVTSLTLLVLQCPLYETTH